MRFAVIQRLLPLLVVLVAILGSGPRGSAADTMSLPGSRLGNCSLRAGISAEVPRVIGGIVASAGNRNLILVRAIGPSLADHGVAQPLPDPELHFFDAEGRSADGHILAATVAVIGGPTIEELIQFATEHVGAFPVSLEGGDVVHLLAFPPGAYTAHVTSRSGATGEVLLEFYDIPAGILPGGDGL